MPIDTLVDLIAASYHAPADARALTALLSCAAALSPDPALALLCRMLADMPDDVAICWAEQVDTLADDLHPDTDAPAIASAVARSLTAHEAALEADAVACRAERARFAATAARS